MGQFQKGNPGGPGGARPGAGRKRGTSREVQARLFDNISEEDWAAITAKAIQQAKSGDAVARALLFNYAFGRPVAANIVEAKEAAMSEFEEFKTEFLDSLDAAPSNVRQWLEEHVEV